jgi:hypothetical protein
LISDQIRRINYGEGKPSVIWLFTRSLSRGAVDNWNPHRRRGAMCDHADSGDEGAVRGAPHSWCATSVVESARRRGNSRLAASTSEAPVVVSSLPTGSGRRSCPGVGTEDEWHGTWWSGTCGSSTRHRVLANNLGSWRMRALVARRRLGLRPERRWPSDPFARAARGTRQ